MLLPMMLFVRADSGVTYTQDSDIKGLSICRPKGWATHDLDREGRRWITDGVIDFVVGDSVKDCFAKVESGQVDATSVNLFLGADTLVAMKLRNTLVPLETPVSEQGMHVVISKKHWRGTTHLYRINAGLQNLKKDGRYQEIVTRHLELFWAQLQ